MVDYNWSMRNWMVRVLYDNGLRSLRSVMHNNRLVGNGLPWSVNGDWYLRCICVVDNNRLMRGFLILMRYYSCFRSCNMHRLGDHGPMRSCNMHRLGNDSRFREMVAVPNSWTFSNRKTRLFHISILDIQGVLDVA
jgi:hypothetical protein